MNLFLRKIKDEKLNKDYNLYQSDEVFEPARRLINEIFNRMEDKDGNFVEDFQSTGFWARLFELFIFEFINENKFICISKYNRPDFYVIKDKVELFIEASTTNMTENDEIYTTQNILNALKNRDKNFEINILKQYTIKIGSVLFSKLNKKYWELEWVKGKPIFIAISAKHHSLSDFLPDYLIFEYLYGINIQSEIINDKLSSTINKIFQHTLGNKCISSAFFQQPLSENISGVIFVNSCDFHKFNRIGYEKGYSSKDILMTRVGNAYDNTPFSKAKKFIYDVNFNSLRETWAEGIRIFHNPNALYPVSSDIFKNIAQTFVDKNGRIEEIMPCFYPFNSKTFYI